LVLSCSFPFLSSLYFLFLFSLSLSLISHLPQSRLPFLTAPVVPRRVDRPPRFFPSIPGTERTSLDCQVLRARAYKDVSSRRPLAAQAPRPRFPPKP
jgi:hypothetical protein